MRMSPGLWTSNASRAAIGISSGSTFSRILHRKILHAASLLVVLLACFSLALAQEELPQITPGERKVPRKKDAGPRAVAVLQLAANGKASLVPIAILINGKFWDASAYKADPVPMSLDAGNVYEVEQSGSSLGLFTVNTALHSNAANSPTPWLATGTWRPAGTEEPSKPMHADITPVGINTEDAPPRLTHDVAKQNTPAAAPGSKSGPSSSTESPSDTSKSGGSSGSGDEPPRLSKPSAPATPPPIAAPSAPSPSQGESKPKDAKPEQAPVPASDSGASEAHRPILRRGKPPESFADEDIPGYSKAGSAASSSGAGGKIVESAAKSDIKLIPAISDAAGPPPRSFKFEWLKGEEGDRHKQMMDLAKQQLRGYIAAQTKAQITTRPARTAARKPASEPILENVQMIAYDLWNSNQPIIVMTATAHMPPPPAGAAYSEVQSELEYSICLVTYPDIYNNLHKLYSGITDKFHLDVTPRLELIDAVDADGDGRGELLFRETSDMGTGWIIYRATGDKLWKMFDSLNPE